MKYFGNKPFKCKRRQTGRIISVLIFSCVFIGISGGGVLVYYEWIRQEPNTKSIAGLVFFLVAFFYFTWVLLLRNFREHFICRIVPYFEKRVATYPDTQPSAFSSGVCLASQCRQLDLWAQGVGARPLSDFGFRDDRDGQKLAWYDTSEGLHTVNALIQKVAGEKVHDDLMNDLVRLRDYLQKAQAQGIRFCLIVRAGLDKWISPVEMDNRKGFFW
jgi:hypothetical protein